MKQLKQVSFKGFCLLAAMIIVIVGIIAYYESHFVSYRYKEVFVSQQKILQEIPDIVINEADIKLMDDLRECKSVAQAIQVAEKNGTSLITKEDPELQEVVLPFETDTLKVWEVHVQVDEEEVYLFCMMRDGTERAITLYSFFEGHCEKTIYLYKGSDEDRDVDTYYSNRDGELSKHVRQRIWFSWFPEKLFG